LNIIGHNPEWFIEDFAQWVAKRGITLSDETYRLLLAIERRAAELDSWPSLQIVLSVLIREMPEFRRVLLRHGLDPRKAIAVIGARIEKHLEDDDSYHDVNDDLYSSRDQLGNRSLIGNSLATRARLLEITQIHSVDVLASVFDVHEAINPVTRNSDWTDSELNISINMLSHILGRYHKELWIPLDTIRRETGALMPDVLKQERIERAPPHVRDGLLTFYSDHPNYDRTCFLIMPFRQTPQLREIHESVRLTLEVEGFRVLRADDSIYSENVFTNIEVYMHGAKFAVSVFERMASDQHNANVALEIGYMLGMGKDVCLLKEKTVPTLPSDLQGRLYTEFDAFSITETISTNVRRWLRERRLTT
jgi:hypothetical protein